MFPQPRCATAGEGLRTPLLAKVEEGGHRPPVAATLRDQVAMRRPPVFHQGGATVPPHPAIEFLQISSALDTRGDEIPLVAGLGSRRRRSSVSVFPQKEHQTRDAVQLPPHTWQASRRRPS